VFSLNDFKRTPGMFLLVPSYLISFVTALYALFAIPTVLECSEIVLLPDFRPTMSIDLRHFFVVAYAIVVFKAFAPLSHFLYSLGRSRVRPPFLIPFPVLSRLEQYFDMQLLSRMQRPINASDSDHVALTLPDEAPPPPLRVLNFNLNEGVGVDGDNQLSALFQSIIWYVQDFVQCIYFFMAQVMFVVSALRPTWWPFRALEVCRRTRWRRFNRWPSFSIFIEVHLELVCTLLLLKMQHFD
jgi:hypothetical protein